MAMLAEKKRRTKWCLNPMGNDWAKDENKFGQKMLEKMGWAPGSGLGVRGQGRTDIIKLSVKNDTRGLGSSKDDEKELWTSNLVKFDSLLAELNGNQKEEMNPVKPEALPSLEEKSKQSKARVHYHKFTRGKDVSKYSSKDLNCILPLNPKETNEQEPTTSINNMYAYFNNKNKNPYINTVNQQEDCNSEDHKTDEHVVHDDEPEVIKTKRKRKHDQEALATEEADTNISTKKKKKKKKKENLELQFDESLEVNQNVTTENSSNNRIREEVNVSSDEKTSNEYTEKRKKKKKKKLKSKELTQ